MQAASGFLKAKNSLAGTMSRRIVAHSGGLFSIFPCKLLAKKNLLGYIAFVIR